ncbi:MAG: anaerobic ribonucleoside triphosphate reductase [Mycoplasmoidaceae bacterium]|nr:MAG: anaerobic ribonucleoside triphosphate reductase [Mycoplasmoidaceae bacterium]
MKVIKRDGRTKPFEKIKISDAILAAIENHSFKISNSDVKKVTDNVVRDVIKTKKAQIPVETIQDLVVINLKKSGFIELSNSYEVYRKERSKSRENKDHRVLQAIAKIGIETDRDNANVGNNFSAKLLRIASEANKWYILGKLLPPEMAKAHETGDYYIHDLDSYNLTINCLHVPTYKMLSEGFNTGYGLIRPAKRIETAADLSCILLQSSQNDMFGGQAHPNFDNDMAPFVKNTRTEIIKQLKELKVPAKEIAATAERILVKRVSQSMQKVIYNLNTMHSRAGAQVPFSSINIGIPDTPEAAMVCQAVLEQYLKGMGAGEQPIFPNIIFRVKKGINREPGDPYYYLFKIATHVSSQRMNPTYMSMDADFNKEYFDKGIYPATMGCRTYVMSNINGKPGTAGRGNIAPVTINLPRLGITAKGNINTFFKNFDLRIEQCRKQLLHRYSVLKNLKVKDLPFVAGQGLMKGSEGLKPNDSIEPIMKQGTWGIGFIGLAETLKALIGKHHGESEEAQALGVKIVTFLREKLDGFKAKDKLNWSCYATPAEGLSDKFTKMDEKFLGNVDWITTKKFYTNSFQVPVDYPISIAKKLEIEAPYHKLCNAGHISYVEFDDHPNGELLEKILRHAYSTTNISYVGFNFHIRYCIDCAERAGQKVSKETVASLKHTCR